MKSNENKKCSMNWVNFIMYNKVPWFPQHSFHICIKSEPMKAIFSLSWKVPLFRELAHFSEANQMKSFGGLMWWWMLFFCKEWNYCKKLREILRLGFDIEMWSLKKICLDFDLEASKYWIKSVSWVCSCNEEKIEDICLFSKFTLCLGNKSLRNSLLTLSENQSLFQQKTWVGWLHLPPPPPRNKGLLHPYPISKSQQMLSNPVYSLLGYLRRFWQQKKRRSSWYKVFCCPPPPCAPRVNSRNCLSLSLYLAHTTLEELY